jgi:hypothetical protein
VVRDEEHLQDHQHLHDKEQPVASKD